MDFPQNLTKLSSKKKVTAFLYVENLLREQIFAENSCEYSLADNLGTLNLHRNPKRGEKYRNRMYRENFALSKCQRIELRKLHEA